MFEQPNTFEAARNMNTKRNEDTNNEMRK